MNKPIFDIDQTPPFMAFRILRDIARESVGEANVLDLSQGEPGYGFSPSKRSRQFFTFLMFLDCELNDHFSDTPLFAYRKESDMPQIEQKVQDVANTHYTPEVAKEILADWDIFLDALVEACTHQGLPSSRFDVLYELFKYSNLSGGRYPQPFGNELLAAVSAEEYSRNLGVKVKHNELIQVLGASHGIGTVFKALGSEGIKFLHGGNHVLMTSPVYAPYNQLFQQRGIHVLSLEVDPITGDFSEEKIQELLNHKERIKCIVLIDPNNPTGFAGNEKFMQAITQIAEAHNSLIVTDEVYRRFFREKRSILSIPDARKRTIMIDSLSKIERATGLRVGDIYISAEANKFITQNILHTSIGEYPDTLELMRQAKSPSGKNIGLFQHITGIPGPSVGLALCHLILGREERENTTDMIIQKMEIFYENLELEYSNNLYYGMFNLRDIESPTWRDRTIYDKFAAIAAQGVVVMPANLFFSVSDRHQHDRSHMVRVSLPNLSFENTAKAARIIRETLQ